MLLWLGLSPRRQIKRQGVVYEIDIREGIDLSLFLFGSFQRHVLQTIRQCVAPDGIVIDVGANVGAVALPIASRLVDGHIYAFEPTEFACSKFQRNVQLNPHLGSRITLLKSFVADIPSSESQLIAYSSWPVSSAPSTGLHPVHYGVAKPTTCGQTTLDAFVADRGLTHLSLIKIDTDGHEFAVLSGAVKCLERFRPVVLFEACEYLMMAPHATFVDFEKFFERVGYTISLGVNCRRLSAAEFHDKCPVGGSLDLVAVANEWRVFET